ncbi:hypothetical protein LTS08_007739 [Lithohypha guttulata]|nr:hypothetical protein LTS08_007739 [Lithohypha guttulata]
MAEAKQDDNSAAEVIIPTFGETTQTLHVKFKDWKLSTAHLYPTDASGTSSTPEPLYIVESHLRKPNLRMFTNVDNGSAVLSSDRAPFANVIFHSFSSTTDIDLNGTNIGLKAKSRWKGNEWLFDSISFAKTLAWKTQISWTKQSWVCMDERALPLARVTVNGFAWKDIGKFEILNPESLTQAMVEELIVTGMTMAFWTIMTNRNASTASSSAASASAASAAASV